MKRVLITLVASGVLSILLAVPAAGNEHCTAGDVQGIAHAGFQGAQQNLFNGRTTGLGGSWADCQFRLYDDNDAEENPDNPEVPHIFTDMDYFLAGIAQFDFYDSFDRPDYDRDAAIEFLSSEVVDRVFWGPAAKSDADLEEIELTSTNYRDAVLDFGHVVGNIRYHTFEPGSLAPGEYKWRWENTSTGLEDFVARGVVVILDA